MNRDHLTKPRRLPPPDVVAAARPPARNKRQQRTVDRVAAGPAVVAHVLWPTADAWESIDKGIPLRGPLVVRVTITHRADRRIGGPCGDAALWHAGEPSLASEFAQVLTRLYDRGWLVDLAQVACAVAVKRTGPAACVRVYVRTLLDAEDMGLELDVGRGYVPGSVIPLFAEDDARRCELQRLAGERNVGTAARAVAGKPQPTKGTRR